MRGGACCRPRWGSAGARRARGRRAGARQGRCPCRQRQRRKCLVALQYGTGDGRTLLPGHEQAACLRPERMCRPGLPHKANAANGCREEFAIGLPAEARHLQDTDEKRSSTCFNSAAPEAFPKPVRCPPTKH